MAPFTITIQNPYWIWADVTLLEIMTSHPDLTGPLDDADKDGRPNIGEYLVDSDPLDIESHPNLNLQFSQDIDGGSIASFSWTERRAHAEFVHAQPQRSTDLHIWVILNRGGVAADAQTATYAAGPFSYEQKQFVRLVFTRKALP